MKLLDEVKSGIYMVLVILAAMAATMAYGWRG